MKRQIDHLENVQISAAKRRLMNEGQVNLISHQQKIDKQNSKERSKLNQQVSNTFTSKPYQKSPQQLNEMDTKLRIKLEKSLQTSLTETFDLDNDSDYSILQDGKTDLQNLINQNQTSLNLNEKIERQIEVIIQKLSTSSQSRQRTSQLESKEAESTCQEDLHTNYRSKSLTQQDLKFLTTQQNKINREESSQQSNYFQYPRYYEKTKSIDYSFQLLTEIRGIQKQLKFQERVAVLQNLQKRQALFTAREMPKFKIRQINFKKTSKPTTIPQEFDLKTEARGVQYQLQFQKKIWFQTLGELEVKEFKARPLPDFSTPFKLHSKVQRLTKVRDLSLQTEKRAHKRQQFNIYLQETQDKKLQEAKQLQIQKEFQEEKEIQDLRKQAQFKAQPIRYYKKVNNKHLAQFLIQKVASLQKKKQQQDDLYLKKVQKQKGRYYKKLNSKSQKQSSRQRNEETKQKLDILNDYQRSIDQISEEISLNISFENLSFEDSLLLDNSFSDNLQSISKENLQEYQEELVDIKLEKDQTSQSNNFYQIAENSTEDLMIDGIYEENCFI